MRRYPSKPRPDWKRKVEALGFDFHTHEEMNPPVTYWNESACYVFTTEEIDRLEEDTATLHQMCLEAVGHVVAKERYADLAIPEAFWPLIEQSWRAQDFTLYGRFDLAYDTRQRPKLLEYNADTPTSLVEAAVVQWFWKEEVWPEFDQWNRVHEALIEQWQKLPPGLTHFAYFAGSLEDQRTVEYLADTATQAGHSAKTIPIDQVGWDTAKLHFTDQHDLKIERMFKLYPWEWWVHEAFGEYLLGKPFQPIEPAWKMVLSNKGILAVLWELFPGHPNLLPASFDPGKISGAMVRKPLLSREGANVSLYGDSLGIGAPDTKLLETLGPYGEEGYVYQEFWPLAEFDGQRAVLGSWIVGDEPAGLGIREDEHLITQNASRFVPHIIEA
ncbi:glutathionylspermidine synthase family protein [Calidithermus chliarophilus]|uniref:glutathionylspermidine synthase family protein n=1 Tax=Calidithermus chliarophilus TaxID=52023 RepID=UPI0003F90045|nr:glutathionylspermidine synthase family protein [Calidithermus chliarophilus]